MALEAHIFESVLVCLDEEPAKTRDRTLRNEGTGERTIQMSGNSTSTESIHDIQRCCALFCAPLPDGSDGMQDEPGYAAVSRSLGRRGPLAQPSAEPPCKAISCTSRFATGVDLPVRLVVVKDICLMGFVRRRPCRVVPSTGDLVNMLGRAGHAGRPDQAEGGWGVTVVEPGLLDEGELSRRQLAIRDARGNPVRSRLPDAFDSLMRFVLTVICDRGEATLQDAVDALRASFWYYLEPQPIEFDRPFHADMMEAIPAFARVDSSIRLERAFPVPDGVAGSVASGDRLYNFSLTT